MSCRKKRFAIIQAIIILVAPILLALFPTERAIACSCIVPGTPAEEIKKFDAVFMGTVTSRSESKWSILQPFKPREFDPIKLGIKVGRSWKGVTTDFVYVHTGYGGGDCGYSLADSETYLFYASGPLDDLNVSICSRTALYQEAQEDRGYLEQFPEIPLMHVASSLNSKAVVVSILLAGTTIVLILGVSYLLVKSQRMSKKNNPAP